MGMGGALKMGARRRLFDLRKAVWGITACVSYSLILNLRGNLQTRLSGPPTQPPTPTENLKNIRGR